MIRLGMAALATCAIALLGCYGSNGQTKDGQSHWLNTCSSDDECEDVGQCICGVCTIECSDSDACGQDAACFMASGDACGSEAPALSGVCLRTCGADNDCMASGLSCAEGACVASGVRASGGPSGGDGDLFHPPDADVLGDGEVPPGRVNTIEGILWCSETHDRHSEIVWDGLDAHLECEMNEDCTCVTTSSFCLSGCQDAIAVAERDAFLAEIVQFNEDYCSDPNYSKRCSSPIPQCTACDPVCFEGRCQQAQRTSCAFGETCPDGLLCHPNTACYERWDGDTQGGEVIAVARDLEAQGLVGPGILAFVVTDYSVIWLDPGTYDGIVHNQDATVYLLTLGGDEPEILADGMAAPAEGMAFDATHVYYTTADGIWRASVDGVDEPLRLVELAGDQVTWVLLDGFIYYANMSNDFVATADRSIRKVRTDGTDDVMAVDQSDAVRHLVTNGDRLFAELWVPSGDTYIVEITDDEIGEQIANPFRNKDDEGLVFISGDFIVAGSESGAGLQYVNIESTDMTWLEYAGGFLRPRSAWRDGSIFSVEIGSPSETPGGSCSLVRSSIADNESERVYFADTPVGHVAGANGYVYWVQQRRLLRKAL